MTERLIALVPMRHHSVRVPEKNYRLLGGRPLYAHILGTLLACREIERVVVDTDSEMIRQGVASDFPRVELIERPAHLTADDVPMNAILAHDVEARPAKFYLQTHSTNPLLKPDTVSKAIEAFFEGYPTHDALFSVTRWQKRLWAADGSPLNHDPNVLLPTQDLPPVFEENSCLYLFEREAFRSTGNRLGRSPQVFEIEADEAWDIDTERDFAIVEALLEARR
jgi:CMP-N-acetylneuraminic acid synthetase